MTLRAIAWLCGLTTIVLMFYALAPHYARRDTLERDYAPLLAADAMVRQHYVAPVERRQLLEGALRGMMRGLDPYSSYLSPEELDACRRRMAGEQVDIGAELGMAYGQPVVIAPFEGSTAATAGLEPGDVIVAVNRQPTVGRSIFAVEAMLFGSPDSRVTLDVYRPRYESRLDITVERRAIRTKSVRGMVRTSNGWRFMADEQARIGYIRIASFAADTLPAFEAALATLQAQDMRGLVLDLRFNPGGTLEPALALVDHFLADGVILKTRPRVGAGERHVATAEVADLETPIVILVNGASASAAEVVAGSLQDRNRATVVGSRTFGKSSVQYFIDLPCGRGGLRVTSAYYVLPSGRIIHRDSETEAEIAWGVTPNLAITLNTGERSALRESWRRLANGTENAPAAPVDRQLTAAMDAMRRLLATQDPAAAP